jgi:HEAT repeat protein
LNRNEIYALDEAVPALLHDFKALPGNLSQDLCAAISLGVKNPTAIPYLTELLASPEVDVGRAAASALVHTDSEEAVAPLEKALEDSDFEERYYGVIGLAQISRQNDWRPSMEDYRADEGKYLRH